MRCLVVLAAALASILVPLASVCAQSAPSMPDLPATPPAREPVTPPPAAPEAATPADPAPPSENAAHALHMLLTQASHASGIYYAKEAGTFTLTVENPGDTPLPLGGQVEFGPTPRPGEAWKPLTLIPVTPATMAAHQRARLEVSAPFGSPGPYELRWTLGPVVSPTGLTLACIFPPRGAADADSPFLAALPAAAGRAPGFLADCVTRTGVRRFLLEDAWPLPEPRAVVGTARRALTAAELDTLLADTAIAKAQLVLRITLRAGVPNTPADVTAFHQHVAALLARPGKAIRAVAIDPADPARPDPAAYRAYYLAAYDAAKKADKTLLMLGASQARATETLLLIRTKDSAALGAYLDGFCSSGVPEDLARALALAAEPPARPLWVLPASAAAPAAPARPAEAPLLLAEGARIVAVPPPEVDRGTTAHLFGGSILFQKLHPEVPPYLAAFQGDGYAVTCIAGVGCGTPLDMAFPALVGRAPGTLEVSDDTNELRIVDPLGNPVDCRRGDLLNIPLDRPTYLLQAGSAEDLVALLRTAPTRHGPELEATLQRPAAAGAGGEAAVTLKLRNVTAGELTGTVRLLPSEAADAAPLAERPFVPIASNKTLELSIPLPAETDLRTLWLETITDNGKATQRFRPALAPAR